MTDLVRRSSDLSKVPCNTLSTIQADVILQRVERPSPEQIALYRAMTPGERLRQAERLYWSARRLREAHERALHPDWSDAEIAEHVRRIFLHAGT